MANVEIDEAQLAGLKQVASVMQKMLNHPESRRKVLEAQKTVFPETPIPEIDAAAPVLAKIEALEKQMADDKKARAEEQAKAADDSRKAELTTRWNKGKRVARDAGYTDEGLEKLEKFMEDKGIADHDVAMAAFERAHPEALPQPVESTASPFGALTPAARESADMKPLFDSGGQSEAWLNNAIGDALNDVRGRGR